MLENLTTEIRNEKAMNLDEISTMQFLKIMNKEDAKVAENVGSELSQIAKTEDAIVEAKRKGGRLIYIGGGTSGRIGLLDAVECPPTFGTDSEEVAGLIAGGEKAFIKAVEGAEDSKELGIQALKDINLTDKDIVVGIAASGRTPYVIGGLEYANSIGVETVAVSVMRDQQLERKQILQLKLIMD